MQTVQIANNPFALLLDPSAVLARVEGSERLNRLASRICRPLDKPVPGAPAEDKASEPESWVAPEQAVDHSDIIR